MSFTVISVLLFILFAYFGHREALASSALRLEKQAPSRAILLLSLLCITLRIVLALSSPGYATDMSCWRGWADRASSVLPHHFYSDSVFCDYAPGYIYILMLLGGIRRIFEAAPAFLEILFLKLPAILFDTFLCICIYKRAEKEADSTYFAFVLSLLYAVNPAIWVNSAVWGQVDAVFTLFLVLSLLFLSEEKFTKSAALLAVSVVVKPQALLFMPIYLLTIWQHRKHPHFLKLFFSSLGVFLGVFIGLVFPFAIGRPPLFIFELYTKTLSSYPYASLNAFNLFTLFGANGAPLDTVFFGLSYGAWGTLGILFSVLIASIVFLRGKDASRYFFSPALLLLGIFLLGTKMHERYLFPAIVLLFLTFIYKRDCRVLFFSILLSVLHFFNVAYIYLLSQNGVFYALPPDAAASFLSFLHLLAYAYMLYLALSIYVQPKFAPKVHFPGKKKDCIIVSAVTILYTLFAFLNLGNTDAPKTAANADNMAEFSKIETISSVSVYKGIGDCILYFEFSDDGENWHGTQAFEGSPCFKWTNYPLNQSARFVRVRFTGDASGVYEAAFFDENVRQIPLSSQSPLFDEQSLAAYDNTYLNSTYFDEIYHARTAFEHIEYTPGHYENTHPPLGKHIIGIGIRLFGMHPFGWRFMGTLFGVLMLPLMYIFAKRLFKSSFIATSAMLLMAFDFMHFSQTRIATIDSYPVFFILLMYFFMYLFYEKAETLSFRKSCLYLLFSGISFGLAIASKWIGFYGGAGLALLFFIALWRRVRAKGIREIWICAFCVLFFVGIPFILYYISYIPINIADGAENHFQNFWNYQKHMFSYHSKLTAEHPFASRWYTWLMVARPIWYYGNEALQEKGLVSSIVGMGNPLIWWVSFLATLFCIVFSIYLLFKKSSERRPLFIAIAYLSQLVPWMFVSRVVFIYHYFASLPFAMFALAFAFDILRRKYTFGKRAIYIFLAFSGVLFLAFYPVLSGFIVPRAYMLSCLKWFPSWILGY